jgi:hypothetical protein
LAQKVIKFRSKNKFWGKLKKKKENIYAGKNLEKNNFDFFQTIVLGVAQ